MLKSDAVEETVADEIAQNNDITQGNGQQEANMPEPLLNDRNKHVGGKSRKRINRRRGNLQRNRNSNNENQAKIVASNKE